MNNMGKSFALILILIMAISGLSLIMIRPASAQQSITPAPTVPIPTPSVPQFTISLVGPPFVVNTTYSLNPNTGQIVAKIGYTNKYSAIVLTIGNQPFNPSYGSIYYNVQIKNQNTGEKWTVVGWNGMTNPEQTTGSEYTNITLFVEGFAGYPESFAGTQTDIQVQAMLGTWGYSEDLPIFTGVTGGWSNTETVNVPANVPLSPTPAPSSSTSPLTPTETPTSTAASSSLISFLLITNTISLIVIAFLLAIIIALLLYMRKRNRLLESNLKGLTKADTRSMRAPKN
jgi:hypothetical protein